MKTLLIGLSLLSSISCFASDFSLSEIVGKYSSKDKKAEVIVKKILIAQATLFEPAKYDYKVDLKVDAGPCMEMYGGDREIVFKDVSAYYNGSWKPVEYLSTRNSGDSDYDGDVYLSDISFRAKKETFKNGAVKYKFELDIDVVHNPDYSDGEDGGEAEFEKCYDQTITSWDLIKK